MANGEDSGTWGSITNTNWNLIEQAISGVQSIVMSNANYTLSNLNGVSDEARNMVLVVTGTNSDIYQIVAPLVPKFFVVTNSTSGGYAITIGGATGSVVSIPNGTTIQVYCDGTNFYSAQTSSAGNFNVNGNLSVTGTSTLTGNTTVGGTLGVYGNASVGGNSTVTGNTTIGGTLGVYGNTTVGGTLAVALPLTATSGIISGSGAAPTFGAYLASNQSITSGVITKVNIDTEEWDTNSNFAAGRFTPTVAGYYQINGGIYLAGVANTQSAGFVYIYKNGSAYKQSSAGLYSYSSISSGNGTISSLVYLNGSTDYVELWGMNVQTGPVFGGGSGLTYFNGAFVRSL